MKQLLFLAGAGALGAITRYAVGHLVGKFTDSSFPLATLLVNVVGCLVIGFVIQAALKGTISPDIQIIITVGFLGAFTTFSAFSHETVRLLSEGAWFHATGNIILNVGLGLLATFAGIVLGRLTSGGV